MALPFLACLLIGYAPVGKGEAVGGTVEVAPFCAVAEHPEDYLGKTVRIRAMYRTDNSHFEFLKLPSCAKNRGLIDIGKHGQSESVRFFYAETKKICTERRALVVCNISAEVDVVGLIREWPGDPGHIVIDLDEINEFTVEKRACPVDSEQPGTPLAPSTAAVTGQRASRCSVVRNGLNYSNRGAVGGHRRNKGELQLSLSSWKNHVCLVVHRRLQSGDTDAQRYS